MTRDLTMDQALREEAEKELSEFWGKNVRPFEEFLQKYQVYQDFPGLHKRHHSKDEYYSIRTPEVLEQIKNSFIEANIRDLIEAKINKILRGVFDKKLKSK